MKNLLCLTLLLALALVSLTAPVLAQETSPAPPAADTAESKPAEEAEAPASQAVEINEDTYRQFMELKDANRQGDIIPETVFKPGSGLQKLDKLPEESQKHLRNELREIIVQGGPWQPGDADKEFPYVPSAAAVKDPALQKQELEAWGELVDGYNQREAEIYENATGSRATQAGEEGNGENLGEGSNSLGETGQESEGTEAQQAGQQTGQQASQDGSQTQADTAGGFSPDAVSDPNARNRSGVSQNAMEFLQNRGQGGSSGSGENTGAPAASGGQPGSPSPAGDQGQSQAQTQAGTQTQTGQQGESGQEDSTATASPTPASSTAAPPTSAASPEASVAGTSQNALEFLQGAGAQAGNQEASDAGSAAADASQGGNSPGTPSQAQAESEQAGQQTGQNDGQASAQASGQGEAQADAQADTQANGAESGESGEQGQAQASAEGEGQASDGQQTETAQKPVSIPPPDSETPVTTTEPEEESTEGSSQNALEYLTGESAATGEAADTTPPPAGTLNIQDLLNAQGLGGTTGTAPAPPTPGDKKPSDETTTDKDGDGQ